MENPLLTEAKKYIPNPDYIVNVYDMLFEWISPRVSELSGYTLEEFKKLQTVDVLDEDNKEVARQGTISHILKNKGVDKIRGRTKDGKRIEFVAEYATFGFNKGIYLVGGATEACYVNSDGTTTPIPLK